jgi:hypothetical protein
VGENLENGDRVGNVGKCGVEVEGVAKLYPDVPTCVAGAAAGSTDAQAEGVLHSAEVTAETVSFGGWA